MLWLRVGVFALIAALVIWLRVEVNNNGALKAEAELREQLLVQATTQLTQQRADADKTDRLIAQSISQRQKLQRKANTLRTRLEDTDALCMAAPIPDAMVAGLYQDRDQAGDPARSSAEGVDRSATSAGHRPTFAEYVAAAEQFFQQCNADRLSVRTWSDQNTSEQP